MRRRSLGLRAERGLDSFDEKHALNRKQQGIRRPWENRWIFVRRAARFVGNVGRPSRYRWKNVETVKLMNHPSDRVGSQIADFIFKIKNCEKWFTALPIRLLANVDLVCWNPFADNGCPTYLQKMMADCRSIRLPTTLTGNAEMRLSTNLCRCVCQQTETRLQTNESHLCIHRHTLATSIRQSGSEDQVSSSGGMRGPLDARRTHGLLGSSAADQLSRWRERRLLIGPAREVRCSPELDPQASFRDPPSALPALQDGHKVGHAVTRAVTKSVTP